MSSISNPGNYLRASRNFPDDPQGLSVELSKTYIDIADRVNSRTIGVFGTGTQIITGETWFINGEAGKQQSLRQVYTFTTTAPIAHGINFASVSLFSRPFGEFTDGVNYYGLFFASNVAIAGQITFFVDPVNINFLVGAGAPALVSGMVTLEWISQF